MRIRTWMSYKHKYKQGKYNFYSFYIFYIEGGIFIATRIKFGGAGIIVLSLIGFISFNSAYFGDEYKANIEQDFFASYEDAITYASAAADGEIFATSTLNGPEVLTAFFTKYNANDYVQTVVYIDPNAEFRSAAKFGRYIFYGSGNVDANYVHVIRNDERYQYNENQFDFTVFHYYSVAVPNGQVISNN
ncbi:hypothetical protein AGMMS50284_6680 [Clostridia bacterium]|nr:hypothetical protein AGMMS50284_6680 [Clostridia bacterium]